ncbi:DUF5610 domain-containing protein [Glaciecola sp. 2405UD65-10]|uniref:DUF5610 domain-containing protein n=1 Tax=Glaciecola sp. 2405UD65-10 TaxID=3397244 RepID=UPI003B595853
MNTVQVSTNTPVKQPGSASNMPKDLDKLVTSETSNVAVSKEQFNVLSANDAVVAKVLSLSINKNVDQSVSTAVGVSKRSDEKTLSEKFEAAQAQDSAVFDIETVTNNVVNFVGNALSNMASNGFDADQISYYRDQAIQGVNVGIDQAKLELVGIADDDLYESIDKTRDSIVGGILDLPTDPAEYAASVEDSKTVARGTQNSYAAVDIKSNNNTSVKLNFDSLAFNTAKETNEGRSIYTSNASNISFSIEAEFAQGEASAIANLVNSVDSLANQFYRKDVEGAYSKSQDLGYNQSEIVNLAKQLNQKENASSVRAYGQIQHIQENSNEIDEVAPKTVAEYLNKYFDVIESSKSTLSEEEDFNKIINGIVNQMEDVQVPDLLTAINRFHAFNSKFTG